ncbi:hypothetical protein [Litoreibacter ponti]|uniref:hypothetical protein n=1 Tax=Litoreibacter ponti TaxID=1510457 RepID=UPI001304B138|nr:hypothetical protein [Litoreibacter ponti]
MAASLILFPIAALSDEALESCLLDQLPQWQFEQADGDAYRATRLAPDLSWSQSHSLSLGVELCDTQIVEAVPIRLQSWPESQVLPELAETWLVRFGASGPDIGGLIAHLELDNLAMAQDILADGVISVGLSAPKGAPGLSMCDEIDFARVAAQLNSRTSFPGFEITQFSIENPSSDPELRAMFESLNPALLACSVSFVAVVGERK